MDNKRAMTNERFHYTNVMLSKVIVTNIKINPILYKVLQVPQ